MTSRPRARVVPLTTSELVSSRLVETHGLLSPSLAKVLANKRHIMANRSGPMHRQVRCSTSGCDEPVYLGTSHTSPTVYCAGCLRERKELRNHHMATDPPLVRSLIIATMLMLGTLSLIAVGSCSLLGVVLLDSYSASREMSP